MNRLRFLLLAVVGAGVLAFAAAGCGGDSGGGGGDQATALPAASCGAIRYGGEGDPDLLIASDLPLQGANRALTTEMADAVEFILQQRDFKVGDKTIGYQSCDDSTAQTGSWDSAKCSANARTYAGNTSLVGVVGTFNSGCAAIIIPVLNQAPDGGIAMVSPANTYPCLTVNLPGGCDSTEPDKYYPSGSRNYVRVVAHDAYQGAAVAEFMQAQGIKSVYILNDKEAYGLGVATTTRKASESVGIKVAGFEAWDPKATSYTSQMQKIKASGADAVFLGGLIDENGAQVIKDKVAVLGPNDGAVKLLAPDGFTTQATIDESAGAAKGMFMSIAGVPTDTFKGAALEFIDGLKNGPLKGEAIDPYAIYGGQAAQVLFDAIENSDGTRADVIKKLFETNVTDGLLGSFKIDQNGDPEEASGAVVGFTIYVATDKLKTETTVSPKPETVAAAGGS